MINVDLNPVETNLTNGAPYVEPEAKRVVTSNDAYYATALSDTENPLDTYMEILNESQVEGESAFMESLRTKFEEEDNIENQQTLENILVDPELQSEEKQLILKDYLYKDELPKSFQNRYISKMSNENAYDTNQEVSDELVNDQQDKENTTVVESSWSDAYDSMVDRGKDTASTKSNEEIVTELAKPEAEWGPIGNFLFQGGKGDYWMKDSALDNFISPPIENVAYWANMIIGEGFQWVGNAFDAFDMYFKNEVSLVDKNIGTSIPTAVAARLLIDYYKTGTKSLDPKKVKKAREQLAKDESEYGKGLRNLTNMLDYIQLRNAGVYNDDDKTIGHEISLFVKDFIHGVLGVSEEDLQDTISNTAMMKFDEKLQAFSEKFSPDDPMLLRLPLELLIGFLGPKGIKYSYKGAKYAKNVAVVGRPGAKLISNIEKTNLNKTYSPTPKYVTPTSKEVIIDANSPLGATMRVNPANGAELIISALKDTSGKLAEVILNNEKNPNWSNRTFLFHLSDGSQHMFKTDNFGWIVDSSVLRELQMISEINATEKFLPPGARDIRQRTGEVSSVVSTLNNVDPSIRMIPSKTYSVFESIETGFEMHLVFRKDSKSDYVSLAETLDSYTELKRALKETQDMADGDIHKELSIVERNSDGNIIRTLNEEAGSINRIREGDAGSTYRIEWKRDKDLYGAFFGEMRLTPADRFPGVKGFILRTLFGLSSSKEKGAISSFFTPYGKFHKKVEDALFGQNLAKEAFFKGTLERLEVLFKKDMNLKEQKQFLKLLVELEKTGIERPNGGEVSKILGDGNLTGEQINKFQTAVSSYRLVTNELHQSRQLVVRRILQEDGYNNSFYANNEVIPVKSDFQFKWQDDFIGIVESETNRITENFSYEVWDFKQGKAILHNPKNQSKAGTHYLQDGTGMPQQQIYALAHKHIAPDGNQYNYAIFGTDKPNGLPRIISKPRDAYLPKMHPEGIVVKRYKLQFKNNGQAINYKNKRDLAVKDLEAFSESIALFQSKKDADAYVRRQNNEDYVYNVDTVSELKRKGKNFSDEQIRRHELNSNKQRTGIQYELDSDPYSTLIRTVESTGAAILDSVNLKQLKAEFVKAIEDNPFIGINKKDSNGNMVPQAGLGNRISDRFPNRDQIIQVGNDKATYNHFLSLWDQLYIYEMGKARGSVANTIALLGEFMAEGSDFVAGQTNVGKKFIKGGRWLQRNPQAAAGMPLKPVTTLWIIMRPVKQFILQSMASAGPIAVVSNFNPAQMFRIYSNAARLTMTRMSNQRNLRKGKSDLSKVIDNYWEQSNQVAKELRVLDGENTTKFSKVSNKDLDYIDFYARRTGASNVKDHVYNQGIGTNTLPSLGNVSGTHLKGMDKLHYANPLTLLNKSAEKMGEWGFEFGESINRDLFIMVAIENFKAKNKGVNWKSDKYMAEIMLDANRLAGGMNNSMAFAWQGNVPMRYLGLFTSFSMKMSERTWNANATPFSGKQRAALLATDFALYGSSLYGLEKALKASLMESEDPDKRQWGEYFSRLNLTYQLANKFGEYLGYDEPGVIPGESLSVHGAAPLGPVTNVLKFLAKIKDGSFEFKDVSAVGAFYSKIFGSNGAVDLIMDVYSQDVWTKTEKAHILKEGLYDLIPFMKAIDKITFGLLENEWRGDETKTGHDMGTDTSPFAQGMQIVLGAPNEYQQMLWDMLEKHSDKKKHLREEAREAIKLHRMALNGKEVTIENIKPILIGWKLKLEKQTVITNTREHDYFVDQAFLILTQQDKTFAEKFYETLKGSFSYSQSYYSTSDIEQIRQLKTVLSKRYSNSIPELDKMEAHMLEANDSYKKENK